MPLSPSDVTFINHLLDRHLKHQRSWPWMRFLGLLGAALFAALGIWHFATAGSISNTFTSLSSIAAPASQPSNAAMARPVTHRELLHAENRMAVLAGVQAWVPVLILEGYVAGGLEMVLGVFLALGTLSRWNHHRRDAILIALLREKCAAELTPPPPQG